jgi:hypothetical protein
MKTLKKLFLFLLVASFASSCDVGDDEELNYGNGSYVAQFPFAKKTGFFLKDDAEIYDYTLPIELVGGNGLAIDKDITITFDIDPTGTFDHDENADTPQIIGHTATEGVNFDFLGPKTLTIPAGSTFASIPLKIYSGTLDDVNPQRIMLKLTNVEAAGVDIVTSGNKGSVVLILQATCTSDLAGNYSNSTIRVTPAGGPYLAAMDVFTEVSTGTYRTSFVGNYYIPGTPPTAGTWNVLDPSGTPGYTFKEVCGRVRVEDQNLAVVYGNAVRQSVAQYAASTVNTTTGVITVEYSIFFTNNTVERPYRSTYTPIP